VWDVPPRAEVVPTAPSTGRRVEIAAGSPCRSHTEVGELGGPTWDAASAGQLRRGRGDPDGRG
jgi:hypothetical protein